MGFTTKKIEPKTKILCWHAR